MLALHTTQPNDAWIGRCTEKCQECCRLRFSHFECTAAVPLQQPPLKHTPNFLDVGKGKNQEDAGLANK
jgi:hypothetical protein